MTVDPALARTIAAAVMDRIERDRTINSEALTETVFAQLAWAKASAGKKQAAERSEADGHALTCAVELCKAIGQEQSLQNPSGRLIEAYYNATQALSAAGVS